MAAIFGIRHLSPASSLHLMTFLQQKQPSYILIEGPQDCTALIKDMVQPSVKAPIAIMAYTKESSIRSILYPFAKYSPEYQAMLWARDHQIPCAFCDLPASAFLVPKQEQPYFSDEIVFDMDEQDLWERVFEHETDMERFCEGVALFSKNLRELKVADEETILREAYMRTSIQKVVDMGIPEDEIVVVCGAYHMSGIQQSRPLSKDELNQIPHMEISKTLMPYSYFRLSSLSGYGAGNKAPAYYELLWDYLQTSDIDGYANAYLSRISLYQREHGFDCSSAQVIEALQLAKGLCVMQEEAHPSLRDLKDAAITCLGHGREAELMEAFIDTDITTTMGYLPKGLSQTAIQSDFYTQMKQMKLERFHTMTTSLLELDLRENTKVVSSLSARLDLYRSFFLHQLRILQIPFGTLQPAKAQDQAWRERWVCRWSSEAEIVLIERSLLGERISLAAQVYIKEQLADAQSLAPCARLMEEAMLCGLKESMTHILEVLQSIAIDAASFEDIVQTAKKLSNILRYGSLRMVDPKPIEPLFHQLFYRSLLLCVSSCQCDDACAQGIMEQLRILNDLSIQHDHYMEDEWLNVLYELFERSDVNPLTSGYAAAILLERGILKEAAFHQMISMRLSQGTPVDIGALWFEGLMQKNHYALIARMFVWERFDAYIQTLDEQDFMRALIYLRRAFEHYHANEKDEIAKNLGILWHLDKNSVSEVLNQNLKKEDQDLLRDLEDFDFGDF